MFIRVLPLEQSKSSIKVVFVPEIKKPNPFLWAFSYLGKTFSCVVALNNFFKAALFFFLTIADQSSLTWSPPCCSVPLQSLACFECMWTLVCRTTCFQQDSFVTLASWPGSGPQDPEQTKQIVSGRVPPSHGPLQGWLNYTQLFHQAWATNRV